MKKIYIEKIAAIEGGLPAIAKEDHTPGLEQDYPYSLPIEYNIEGELVNEITIGSSVIVNRTKRNNVVAYGTFTTSRVTEIGENYFKTQNSHYIFKYI